MNNYFRSYKKKQAEKPVRKLESARLRQNALSAASGIAAAPKDFDWVTKNIPCQAACPARTDIPAYLAAIAQGDFAGAYRINLRDNVFPAVLGRVCTRPCEPACRHGWEGLGEPVAICFSKRSAADFLEQNRPMVLDKLFSASGKKIVVAGGGAAGLAAARDLALLGHSVTVLERHDRPGGMMVQGIPHFRLPRKLVELEIEQIRQLGVEFRCGVEVGKTVAVDDLRKDFDALVIAAGTMKANRPGIPGAGLPHVRHGLEFLRAVNGGDAPAIAGEVVVIGGGFTAVDCARTAQRLGAAKVSMFYRRSEAEMYITPGEVEEMRHEGIVFETLAAPVAITEQAVELARTEMTGAGKDGRRDFTIVAGSNFSVPAQAVLLATGQVAEDGWLTAGQRNDPKVFLAGDFAAGARSLIDAIADGRACARRVDRFLMGEERVRDVVSIEDAGSTGRTRELDALPREPMPVLEAGARGLRDEVETGLARDAAMTEASRCYLCHFKFEIDNDLCIYCDRCLKVKPVEDCIVKVSELIHDPEERITGYRRSSGSKDYNLLYIDQSKCIRCGACKEVCPVECISLQKVNLKTVCGPQG